MSKQQNAIPVEVMAQLQVDVANIKTPYVLAIAKIISTSLPQKSINIHTGEVTEIYDSQTQKVLSELNYCMETLVDSYIAGVYRAYGLKYNE